MSVKLRKRKRENGKVYVYLDIYQHGSRKTEMLGVLSGDRFHDKEDLKLFNEIRVKREHDLLGAAHGVMGTYKKRESFIRYCETLAELREAENTRASWRQAIDHLKTFGGEQIVFASLSRQFFERFRDYLLKEAKLSPNSAQIYLARIKTALHQAVADNILPVDPSASVKIQKKDSLPVHLTLEEVQQLSETPCPNDQVRAAFLFSCFAGMRYSDVEALTWDKVKGGEKPYIEFRQQKTRQSERLYLSEEAARILEGQKAAKPSDNLVRTFKPGTVFFMPSQPVADKQLKKWGAAAGIDKRLSFHKARHTFATLSLSSGVDLYTTSRLLGHKNIATTQIYAKVVDEKKRQAVGMLPTLATPGSEPINHPRPKNGKE